MEQFTNSADAENSRVATPVLICGGNGDNLWPSSRAQIPEALADIGRDLTLLQEAALRVASENEAAFVAIGKEEHRFLILDQLQDVGLTPHSIILWNGGASRRDAIRTIAAAFAHSDELLRIVTAEQPSVADDELVCTGRELAERCGLSADDLDNQKIENDGLFVRVAASPTEVEETDNAANSLPETRLSTTDWNAVWQAGGKDERGNVVRGTVLAVDTEDSLVQAEAGITVATLGMKDHVVVATADAVLVAPRSRAGDLPKVVEALNAAGNSTAREPGVVHRPWGTYQTTDRDERFQTKRIVVKPGAKLSSQLHHHRSEHWVVVSGTAEVTVGEKTFLLHENESTYIKAGTVHRLANPGRVPLHLVEVQCGTYLGEDDIVRFDDVYGRS